MPARGRLAGQDVLVFDLEQPRTPEMPIYPAHRLGYSYALHRRHSDPPAGPSAGPRSSASGLLFLMEHTGTHIDAPCHQAWHGRLHGDIDAITVAGPWGFTHLGVETVPPLVVPGALLDVAALHGREALSPGELVTTADLAACCTRDSLSLEPGMAILVAVPSGTRPDAGAGRSSDLAHRRSCPWYQCPGDTRRSERSPGPGRAALSRTRLLNLRERFSHPCCNRLSGHALRFADRLMDAHPARSS